MHQMLLRLYFGLGIICGLGSFVCAQQLNVDRIQATVVQGEQWAQTFTSTEFLNIIYDTDNGIISAESGAGNDDIYFAKYTPFEDFLGSQTFAVEYVDYFGQKWYTEVEIKVVKSKILPGRDFIYIPPGSEFGSADVLRNDVKTDKFIEIIDIGPVRHGIAQTDDNDHITFTPDPGFFGTTAFVYTVRDSHGTTAVGKVLVNVADQSPSSTVTQLTVVNTDVLELVLPNEGFRQDANFVLAHGSIQSTSSFSYDYKPKPFSAGVEIVEFVNRSGVRQIFEIEVIDDQEDIDFVVDDKIYTTEQQYVSFDPRANDYSQDGIIVDFSPELIYGSGVFAYHPPAGFSGVKHFYYVVHDGFSPYKGKIDIYVGNYLPQKIQYDLVTQQNTPHILEYQVPVSEFEFNIKQSPANGLLLVNQTVYSDPGSCGTVSGHELIVYQPNKGFVGSDDFIVEYCTDQGACKEVEVRMTIEESNASCRCIGPDCVWSGDTNNDGKVSVLDLLPIGYHYGESGPPRTDDGADWMAQSSTDWLFNQKEALVNTKFADTDGNGIINTSDVSALYTNYNAYHNLVPSDVLIVKDIPLYFDVSDISAKAGDMVEFKVMVGTDDLPVLEIQGLAFSIQVPPSIAREGTMYFTFDDHSWFAYHAPVLSMVQQTGNRGRMDAAIVRIDGSTISGKGTLGSAGLAVIIDLDGARPTDDIVPVTVTLDETIVSDGSGTLYRIKAQELVIHVDISDIDRDVNTFEQVEVVTYPNPSTGELTFHANNRDELGEIEIFNTVGERVFAKYGINQTSVSVDLDVPQGMYLAHILTQKGKSVQKIQIVRK